MQGPVKRFGVKVSYRKSQKHRAAGALGAWHPATVPWFVPRAGQHGYHTRTELNKKILMLGKESDSSKINPKGGIMHYGLIKNDFILLSGSVPGPKKRLIALRKAIRDYDNKKFIISEIKNISTRSQQRG
jgi:large subunit ribosomal protein L3